MENTNLINLYKKFSAFELMMLFHLHKKEAEFFKEINHPKADKVEEIAKAYLEVLDILIQDGLNPEDIFKVEQVSKEALKSFLLTRRVNIPDITEEE